MDDTEIEHALVACEQRLQAGQTPDLRALGFWRAVAAVKGDRALVSRFVERIAFVDLMTFRQRVALHFPVVLGYGLLVAAVYAGVVLLALARGLGHPWREIAVLTSAGLLDGCTHGIAHFVVGTIVGIRFTDWFVTPPKPPGFKIDYASYLRASPRRRAWMHAAGAIATKLTPFLVIPYAVAIGTDAWAALALFALGVVQIVTDLLYSVRASDWKKFRREMRLARRAA